MQSQRNRKHNCNPQARYYHEKMEAPPGQQDEVRAGGTPPHT